MSTVVLGKTGITVGKNGFGALPIQRVSHEEAGKLLLRAYEAGVTYFDTARAYSDSEEKIGRVMPPLRDKIYLATKTQAKTADQLLKDLEISLSNLKTDYIDVYQFHNPPVCPKPGDGSGLYEEMVKLKEQGVIKHIAITNHRLDVANEAVDSGLYELLQYPFSYLSDEKDIALVHKCAEKNVGFVAMKAMSGGLITNSRAAYAFMEQYPNVLPIWGVQRPHELEEFLSYHAAPPSMEDESIKAEIAADRAQLSGNFCRGCGYCLPCPVEINIPMCARMTLFLQRAPMQMNLTEESQKMMENIDNCTGCEACKSRCPYGLDTPELLKKNLANYREVLAGLPA